MNEVKEESKINNIKNKLLVMSGKGGVGKTTIAVNLAYALAAKGFRVGLLDIDIHGPNVPKMLKLESEKLSTSKEGRLLPVRYNELLKVVSVGFLVQKGNPVIWRGPLKHKLINQFVKDVEWGNLDFLIVDFPAGTGDEAISISQLLKGKVGSVIVSLPQQVSLLDAERAINFSKAMGVPSIGIIENMSGELFGKGKVEAFAEAHGIHYLGSIPLSKEIVVSSDEGIPFVSNENITVKDSFEHIVKDIIDSFKGVRERN